MTYLPCIIQGLGIAKKHFRQSHQIFSFGRSEIGHNFLVVGNTVTEQQIFHGVETLDIIVPTLDGIGIEATGIIGQYRGKVGGVQWPAVQMWIDTQRVYRTKDV